MAKDYNEIIQILWRYLNECCIDPSQNFIAVNALD